MLCGMNFRADFFVGDRLKVVRHFTAGSSGEALETARQQVVALGVEHADVWGADAPTCPVYVGNVEAER